MPGKEKDPSHFTGRPVWAEVSLSALAENYRAIREHVNPASEERKTPRKVLSIGLGTGILMAEVVKHGVAGSTCGGGRSATSSRIRSTISSST